MITNLSTLFLAALIANGMLQIAAGATLGTTSPQQTSNTAPAAKTNQPASSNESRPNPDSSGKYHVGDGVTAPQLTFAVEPEFSEQARKKHIRGTCTVSLTVGPDGIPINIHITKSVADGVAEKLREAAHTLDENCTKSVEQYRYKPATYRGKPVPVELTVEVEYHIF
jgi:outer membrane biosynthesis protein TonB